MEFHDAQIKCMKLDFERRTGVVHLIAYRDEIDSNRVEFEITCDEVSSLSMTVDLNELSDHWSAGNVVSGRIHETQGRIAIYLTGGAIIFDAVDVSVIEAGAS